MAVCQVGQRRGKWCRKWKYEEDRKGIEEGEFLSLVGTVATKHSYSSEEVHQKSIKCLHSTGMLTDQHEGGGGYYYEGFLETKAWRGKALQEINTQSEIHHEWWLA
jgi:hypothetical protein